MQKINSETDLKVAIFQLESKQAGEGQMLKEQFRVAYDSVQPINIIKNTFSEIAESEELRDNILITFVGVAAGYLSKKIFESTSSSPFKRLVGTALMVGVTNLVAKNPKLVMTVGRGIFRIIVSKLEGRQRPDLETTETEETASTPRLN
jgi:hypothetical protein